MQYIVRIELHDHQDGDYDVLHAAMAARGFTRTIVADNGLTYDLPTATYRTISLGTLGEIGATANTAAATTKREHIVLVTPADSWMSYGLKLSKPGPIDVSALALAKLYDTKFPK